MTVTVTPHPDLKLNMLKGNHLAGGACYTTLQSSQWVAFTMLISVHRIISAATILHNVERIRKSLGNIDKFCKISRGMDLAVLDAMRICTSFENYMKAVLIEKGFVIHQIDKRALDSRYRHLAKEQKTRPIKSSEIKEAEGLKYKRGNGYDFKSLKTHTLSMSFLLSKEKYVAAHKLNPYLIGMLTKINKHRNTLHCLIGDSSMYSEAILDEYAYMKNFVNTHIVARHDKLKSKLGFKFSPLKLIK